MPEFWGALDQQLKPSLNYTITLALLLDEEPPSDAVLNVVEEVNVDAEAEHLATTPGSRCQLTVYQYWRSHLNRS